MFQFVEPAHQEMPNKSRKNKKQNKQKRTATDQPLRKTKGRPQNKCRGKDANKLPGNSKHSRSWPECGILLAVTKFPLVKSPCGVSGDTLCSENIGWSGKSSRGSIINGSESQECSSWVITPAESKGVPAVCQMRRASDWYSGISWWPQIRLTNAWMDGKKAGEVVVLPHLRKKISRLQLVNKIFSMALTRLAGFLQKLWSYF